MMPASVVRLSAGRTAMSEELQALCFLAGGDTLLTTPNPEENRDMALFDKLGIVANGEQERVAADHEAA